MPTRNPSRTARAVILIEVLASLVLLGVFFLVATRVFMEAHNLNKRALETTAGIERLDNAIRRLRRDAWNATTFQAPTDQQLLITQNPNTNITWTVMPNGDLTRAQSSPSAPEQSWTQLPPIRVSVKNPAVLLAITENNQTQNMTLPSQVNPPEALP